MELIQPVRQSQLIGQAAMVKHAPGKRLLLVDPYPRNNPYRLTASERRAVWFPKLSLPTIAAYTPENWEVSLVDEAVQDIDFDYPCDMVGLSMMTCYAPRAYEIATEFRKRGKTIVMGGVHPTYCPDEALRYADAIVCGEAEDLWPQLVADYEAGKMQRMYKMTSFPSLEKYKSPRVELLSPDSYMTRQCSFTTRGCHFDCEFCSVSPFNGKTTRRRPVQEVITELRNVQRWIRSELVERLRDEPMWRAFVTALRIRVGIEDGSIVAFVDDLHNSNRAYCRELWAALKPLKIKWGCQATMFLADDEEMVKLAAESGCVSVFVGMESLDEDALDETNKPFNRVLKFSKEIKMFHDYGIMVNPGNRVRIRQRRCDCVRTGRRLLDEEPGGIGVLQRADAPSWYGAVRPLRKGRSHFRPGLGEIRRQARGVPAEPDDDRATTRRIPLGQPPVLFASFDLETTVGHQSAVYSTVGDESGISEADQADLPQRVSVAARGGVKKSPSEAPGAG